MPAAEMLAKGGRSHGFQLWVNLPSRDKMIAPRYQELKGDRIPSAKSEDGLVEVRVIAGESLGTKARIETHTPISYLHFTLKPGGRISQPIADGQDAFAYVFEGEARVGSPAQRVGEAQAAILAGSGPVELAVDAAAKGPAGVLLIAGAPIREPVARYGPFVMNTEAEIRQAIVDFNSGRLGKIG
jgi:redox-sensitive bicupin YhaK (pirin superfamily)